MKSIIAGSREWLELYRDGAFSNRPPVVEGPKRKNMKAIVVRTSTAELLSNYGAPCPYCERPMLGYRAPSRDHVRPRHTGATLNGNKLIVCRPCNMDKGGMSLEQFVRRLEKHGDLRAAIVRRHLKTFGDAG